jgi:bifunctional DNA-binding transcriptional regulator/antitoxin component of YhaV-PrlF toxin-antitoxin module
VTIPKAIRDRLGVKEGEKVKVATGLYRGPKIERIRFEDLAALVKQDYQINKRKTVRRIDEYMNHLKTFFRKMRATSITTERIKTYIAKRQYLRAENSIINR